MSNFTSLAMQNRDAEAMRKKRKKAEIEDALLGGGSGGSGSSESSGSSMESSSVNPSMYQTEYSSGGSGSFLGSLADAGAEWAFDKVAEKIGDKIEEKLDDVVSKKLGKEIAEKAGKELVEKAGKEVVEEVAETGIKKLGGKIASRFAMAAADGVLPIGDAIALGLTIYDIANWGTEALTGKDIGDHLKDVGDWVGDKFDDAKDWAHEKTGWNIFEDEDERKERQEAERKAYEKKRKKDIEEAKKGWEEAQKKKEMAEAEKAKKEAEKKLEQEKLNKKSQEDEEEEEEEEEEADGESSGKSAVKKGLTKGLTHTLGTFGGAMGISLSMIGVYRVHYTGEFEFKGIGAEYQSENYTFQNFVDYDKNGDVVLKGLTKENKLMKTFYTKYSDKSYYAIVEDKSKYGDNMDDAYLRKNLLTPDELREQYPEIVDVNNREAMFQLNPDVLYVLDKYIHKDKVMYPQQFVKPVFYEESQENFGLKDLVDDKGRILAKSQMFDNNGKPLKNADGTFKTTEGIWDYGFASVIRYKEYDVERREVTAPIKREVKEYAKDSVESKGEIGEEAPIAGNVPNASISTKNISKRDKPVYMIDAVVTPGGTISIKEEEDDENKSGKSWQRGEGPSSTDTKVSYYSVKTGEKKQCTSSNPNDTGMNTPDANKPDSDGVDIPGSNPEDISSPLRSKNPTIENGESCTVVPTYTIYEVTDHYETYVEEAIPQSNGELTTENITGSEYFRDYMSSYSNYYPEGLPSRLDFKVLENEELKTLIYDDDPNAFGTGGTVAETSAAGRATEDEFKNAVFFGDSITVGLGNSIPSAKTVAEVGYTAEQGYDRLIDKVISQKPPVVVVSFGANDAGYKKPDWFKDNYIKLINKLKSDIPGVKIYINKIFPGDLTKPNSSQYKASIENIPEHNGLLSTIASTTGATLIDCTNIPDLKSYYTNDGLHFKDSFNTLWYNEMKKQIVGTASSVTPSGATAKDSSRTVLNMRTASLQLPTAMPGEERNVMDVLKVGSKKDSPDVVKVINKYMPYCEKYGKAYGIDPYLIVSKIINESTGNPNMDEAAIGLMQIEKDAFLGKTIKAYNQETKSYDSFTISSNGAELFDPETNIKVGTMNMAKAMEDAQYNILVGLQSYNFGTGGIRSTIQYYLSGGTLNENHTTNEDAYKWYLSLNHSGWITAQYPGDMPCEKRYPETRADGGATDNKHSARTWYSSIGWKKYNQGTGTPVVIERDLAHYAGDGSPWIMNKEGEVITLDGAASSMGSGSGGGTPSSMFNAYLKSNWATIEEKWDELFPGQSELDKKLDIVKKGDYTQLYSNYEAKARAGAKSTAITMPRSIIVESASMNKVDIQLALNMMFALNQGNYLFKYDNITEAEWKAMYTQLLSSPTGQTWDDKWIGFNVEDIFGVKMKDLGTLFPEDIGVTPTISVPYGMVKNVISGSENELAQYNKMNFGIDIIVPPDTDVLTVADGEVVSISKKNDINSRYGNYVKIQHAKGTTTITANLKTVKVKVGDKVKKGDIIGTSGGDCRSYKDNAIHYQIIHNGTLINPTWVITREMTGFEDPIQGNNGVICDGGSAPGSSGVSVAYVETALKQTDKPYVYDTAGPNSFDCSGLVQWSMKQHGIDIPRDSRSQRKATQKISYEELQRGDLIFRHGPYGTDKGDPENPDAVEHVMIYLGNGEVVHASSPERGIRVDKFERRKNHSFGRYSQALTGSTSVSTSVSSGCQAPSDIAANNNGYLWPVPDSSRISAPFGEWRDNNTRQHKGIDIAGKYGGGDSRDYNLPIVASVAGEVVATSTSCPTNGSYGSSCGGGWGNYVKVKDAQGNFWIYAHMSQGTISVQVGQTVNQGQELGKMGNSGSSKGVHLHFEIREGKDSSSNAVDPLKYVKPPS